MMMTVDRHDHDADDVDADGQDYDDGDHDDVFSRECRGASCRESVAGAGGTDRPVRRGTPASAPKYTTARGRSTATGHAFTVVVLGGRTCLSPGVAGSWRFSSPSPLALWIRCGASSL